MSRETHTASNSDARKLHEENILSERMAESTIVPPLRARIEQLEAEAKDWPTYYRERVVGILRGGL